MGAPKPGLRPDEAARISALHSYDLLDTPREADYDEVVEALAQFCDAPISVINLIDRDRQWFKAEVGLGLRETTLDVSICAHAILQPGLFVVPDTLNDPRFKNNPLVTGNPHLRFYAGALLESEDGLPLGTVCVLDYKPRELNQQQLALIQLMAKQVMRQIELRHIVRREEAARADLVAVIAQKTELLRQNEVLAREVDHRVKNSLQMVLNVLRMQARASTSAETKSDLGEAELRVHAIATVHEQLNRTGSIDRVGLREFLGSLCASVATARPAHVTEIECQADRAFLSAEQAVSLGLIVNELLANALKHAFPDGRAGKASVLGLRTGDAYTITVSDDGVGISSENAHHGSGTRIIEALGKRLGSDIRQVPAVKGTCIQFSLPLDPSIE